MTNIYILMTAIPIIKDVSVSIEYMNHPTFFVSNYYVQVKKLNQAAKSSTTLYKTEIKC